MIAFLKGTRTLFLESRFTFPCREREDLMLRSLSRQIDERLLECGTRYLEVDEKFTRMPHSARAMAYERMPAPSHSSQATQRPATRAYAKSRQSLKVFCDIKSL